jgi:IS605 OrfB family transposase
MLTYNIELIPDCQVDLSKIKEILELNLYAWNSLSKTQYEVNNGFNRKILHDNSYSKIRRDKPEIPSQVIIRAENDVISTYRSIKSNEHEIIGPAIKRNLSMRLDKRLYRLEKDRIFITTTGKRVGLKFKFYTKFIKMMELYPIGDPLVFMRGDRVFLSVPFKNGNIVVEKSTDNVFGIDMGMNNIAVTSEGLIYSGKQFLAKKRMDRHIRKCLYQKGTKSARKKARKNKGKETRRGNNFCHQIANAILQDGQGSVLALENLKNIKKNTLKKAFSLGRRNFNGKWANMPIMTIQTILEYKAAFYNKRVCYVSPTNTSKIDSRTNKKDGTREKGRYIGKDGKTLHSDINASVNIANRSKLPLSGDSFVRNCALYGQAVVNRPIVYKSSSCRNLDAVQATAL